MATATADLEALCGHAVVLDNREMFEAWNVPEAFEAAVCLPVSSPTTPLGTVWFFADHPRDFSDAEINLLEIVAGRLAADLEREVLLTAGAEKAKLSRQIEAAERIQQNQLPRIAPLVDGWQFAGWSEQAGALGGNFYDWLVRGDDQVLLAVGECLEGELAGALTACSLRSAWRAHSEYDLPPHRLLERANHALWNGSAGDQYGSLFCGQIDPTSGRLTYAAAGHLSAVLLKRGSWHSIVEPSVALGQDPESQYASRQALLSQGEVLVVMSAGVREACDLEQRPLGLSGLARMLAERMNEPARALAETIRQRLQGETADRTVLVLKRLAR